MYFLCSIIVFLPVSDHFFVRLFQLYTGPNRPLRQVDKWNAWFFEDLNALVSIVAVTQ